MKAFKTLEILRSNKEPQRQCIDMKKTSTSQERRQEGQLVRVDAFRYIPSNVTQKAIMLRVCVPGQQNE